MTTKEMLTAVIAANLSDEITAKAKEMLTAAEKKNTKRTAAQSENRTANIAIAQAIAAAMTEGNTYAASEIKTLIAADYPDISTAKITAVCKVATEENIFTAVSGYKVGGKGRAVKGYRLADTAVEDTTED